VFEATLHSPSTDPSAEEFVVADVSVREALGSLSDDDREILLLNAWTDSIPRARRLLRHFDERRAVRLSRAQAKFRELLSAAEVH